MLGYEYQQTPYPSSVVHDDQRKRGIEQVVSPSQINGNHLQEKRLRSVSPVNILDMDTGILRQHPREDAIMTAINKLSAEVSTNVKTTDLKGLATKEDIKNLQSLMEIHTRDINDLKTGMSTHAEQLAALSELANRNAAAIIDLGQRSSQPDVGGASLNRNQYGSQRTEQNRIDQNQKRMNLVIEGIPENMDLYEFVIKLGSDMNIIVYLRDIVIASRLRRREVNNRKPPPVLVTFVHPHLRDAFLRNKHRLKPNQTYKDVWINADEPFEIRRLKAEFRRIAWIARGKGQDVYFNHRSITIGGKTYTANELPQIPNEYRPDEQRKEHMPTDDDMDTMPPLEEIAEKQVKFNFVTKDKTILVPVNVDMSASAQLPQDQVNTGATNVIPETPTLIDYSKGGTVNMRLTSRGLCFSGPTCPISNMYECEFEDDDGTKCYSVEQRNGYLRAVANKDFELAHTLLSARGGFDIKNKTRHLPKDNPEWNRIQYPTLKRLFVRKMMQNPDIKQALFDTAPHKLIEASWDIMWGGGQPFNSVAYDNGTFKGLNKFGDMATNWRDEELAKLAKENR